MTPNKKAEELVNEYLRIEDNTTFYWNTYYDQRMFDDEVISHAKKCALIAVNEVLKAAFYAKDEIYNFYIDVKIEIEKL
jgi:hypothetical protein